MTIIHPPIHIFLDNNFDNLYDVLVVKVLNKPERAFFRYMYWMNLIERVEILVKVASVEEKDFMEYDKVVFSDIDRKDYYECKGYNPISLNNNVVCFHMLPYDFLRNNLDYLYGLRLSQDFNYHIIFSLYFNDFDRIFFWNDEKPDFSETRLEMEFLEINTTHPIFKNHCVHWQNKKSKKQNSQDLLNN